MARKKPRQDLYRELDVPRDADAKTIRRAYRQKAKQAHPDTGGDAASFERLRFAMLVLTDQRRRAEYDRTGGCDEPGPDAMEANAMGLIGAALGQALRAKTDIFTMDLRGKIMADIGQSLGEYKSSLADATRCRKRAEKLMGRFIKKTSGTTMIDGMLRNYAAEYHAAEARLDEAVAHHARALEILKDHDFMVEPPQPGTTQPHQHETATEVLMRMHQAKMRNPFASPW